MKIGRGLLLPLLAMFIVTACGPVYKTQVLNKKTAKQIHSLSIKLKSNNDFEVYKARSTATTAPAAMFGLIGAVVASSIDTSEDDKQKDALQPYLQGVNDRLDVSSGLHKGLIQKPGLSIVDQKDRPKTKADGLLDVTIQEWGLKITDQRHDSKLTPFVQIRCVVRQASGNKTLMDMVETYYGDNSHSIHEYKGNGQLFKKDMNAVLQKAGLQIGTRLAYTLGGKG